MTDLPPPTAGPIRKPDPGENARTDPPEPGSPRTAFLAGLALIVLVGVVALLQQLSGSAAQPQTPPADQTGLISPPTEELELTGKVLVKLAAYMHREWKVEPSQMTGALGGSVRSDADVLRIAIVDAELLGAEAFERRVADLEKRLPEDSALALDIRTTRSIYTPDAEPPATWNVDRLVQNHGWFGRLAASAIPGRDSPAHAQLLAGGGALLLIISGVMVVGTAALIAGCVLLLIGLIGYFTGERRPHFVPGPPRGSVYLETAAVFVGSFLVLKLTTALVDLYLGPSFSLWFALVCQWLLLLSLLWPWWRGLPLGRAMHGLGLHRGRGVLTEIGCGFLGYIACLPLLAVGVATSMVLLAVYAIVRKMAGLPEAPPPSNDIIEIVSEQRGSWLIVLLFLLASLWAPLAEESVFRGALFGHLRRRWHWAPAAIASALAFGLMHGYQLLLLGPVIALGAGFALLREWRGSLIAPITAHCFHNAGVLTLLLTVFSIVGD